MLKTALYLWTYTAFQLYELSDIDQQVFLHHIQVSNLFCGLGWTKLVFWETCSLTKDRNQHGRFLMETTKREEKTLNIDIVKTNQGEKNIKTANLRDKITAK